MIRPRSGNGSEAGCSGTRNDGSRNCSWLARCSEEAADLLAQRLTTPLQIEQYLTRALDEGFRVGERPVSAPLVEAILSPQLDELEPRWRRYGYDVRAVAELDSARTADIQALFRGELEAARTREITNHLRAAGLPI